MLIASAQALAHHGEHEAGGAGAGAATGSFDLRPLAYGFDLPTAVDWTPDGTMLVSEKRGRIQAVEPDGDRRLLLDISAHVATDRERGLYDIEVHPAFASNRIVYLLYTHRADPLNLTGPQSIRLTRIELDGAGNVLDPGSPETVVLGADDDTPCPPIAGWLDCIPSITGVHQGGTVAVDPGNGTLWVTVGDSNLPSTPGAHNFRTFDPRSLSGKVLHVDRNGRGLPSHPFCPAKDELSHACTKVWAKGFRNPFRLALRPGRPPMLADVGWDQREEINVILRGRDYGWPCYEGSIRTPFYREQPRCRRLYSIDRKLPAGSRRATVMPLHEYPNPGRRKGPGAAAIMGPAYPGGPYPPAFDGAIFFGDYAGGVIKALKLRRGAVRKVLGVASGVYPVDLQIAPNGNLAYVDIAFGQVGQVVHSPGNKAPHAAPEATPTSGPLPLEVEFGAGASSDPDGDALSYEWEFGDGAPPSNQADPTHEYTVAGAYEASLTVSDGNGGSDTRALTIHAGNSAPTATILSPANGSRFKAGVPVSLVASANDPEDGALGDDAVVWDVVLMHVGHVHTLGDFPGASAQLLPVTDHDANSYYLITPQVTDSEGLSRSLDPIRIDPATSSVRLRSEPRGVRITYGGSGFRAPRTLRSAIGYRAQLAAPVWIRRGEAEWRFLRWSQGGPRVQVYRVQDRARQALRAIYARAG